MKTMGTVKEGLQCKDGYMHILITREPLPAGDGLDVEVKKHHQKRSLDANAYHWVLCEKIARVIQSDAQSVHYDLVLKYGTMAKTEDDYPLIVTTSRPVDFKAFDGYARMIHQDDESCQYLLFTPSRFYDSAEMARLNEGTVSEAKELGIETLTPAELMQMGV